MTIGPTLEINILHDDTAPRADRHSCDFAERWFGGW